MVLLSAQQLSPVGAGRRLSRRLLQAHPSSLEKRHAPAAGIAEGHQRLNGATLGCGLHRPGHPEITLEVHKGHVWTQEADADDLGGEP